MVEEIKEKNLLKKVTSRIGQRFRKAKRLASSLSMITPLATKTTTKFLTYKSFDEKLQHNIKEKSKY